MQQTETYLGRTVDQRMVTLIEKYLPANSTVLDLGCGSGLYGASLRQNGRTVFGFDYDRQLCDAALASGQYQSIICGDILDLQSRLTVPVDAIFCSETLEHVSNENLPRVLGAMEAVTKNRIAITVPNPLSPHFRLDPTHILRYNIYSFLRQLNTSKDFVYCLYPLGFSQYNLQKSFFRVINPIASRLAFASPTVLYLGSRKTVEKV